MIVAVVGVPIVQMSRHDIIGMVDVRHGLMTAFRLMAMRLVVRVANMPGRAVRGISCRCSERVLVDMIFVDVVQMAVMEVI